VARISGIAMRHARWSDLTEAETAAGEVSAPGFGDNWKA
jgi:hypothetical protein